MANLRESKALLWVGFTTYLVLSAVSAIVVAYTDGSQMMGIAQAQQYLFGFSVYRIVLLLDKPIMAGFIMFALYMDNNPGTNRAKEVLADVTFVGAGFLASWAVYAIAYCMRMRSVMAGGLVGPQIDEYFNQGILIFVYLFLFYHSIKFAVKMTKDRSNLPKPAPQPKPHQSQPSQAPKGGSNGGGNGNSNGNSGGGNGGKSGGSSGSSEEKSEKA